MSNIASIPKAPIPFSASALLVIGQKCPSNVLAEKLEFVSYSPNGLKYPFIRNALKLFAKSLNVYVNRS